MMTDQDKSPRIQFGLSSLPPLPEGFELLWETDSSLPGEGYRLKWNDRKIILSGSDSTGIMYGLFDLKDQILSDERNDRHREPYLKKRGLKFNIPLDVRTPSYSDGSDSARQNIENMWDRHFWIDLLDRMARDRMNTLSLWNEHPFPSLVKLEDYPLVALDDVKKPGMQFNHRLQGQNLYDEAIRPHDITIKRMTIDEKITFWRDVMSHARDRGIKVYICTWNIFVYGTEGNPYGIDDKQDNPVTADYFRKSVAALVRTYPLLAGIGVTSGENMDHSMTGEDSLENWMFRTYGRGIMDGLAHDRERDFTFIHRAHETRLEEIYEAFKDFSPTMDLSFKYSQAHMYGAVKPSFGDGFFKAMPEGAKTWLTVRDDDYYLYRHGHPRFARDYIKAMPRKKTRGIYMGPDGYVMGKEYVARDGKQRAFYEKMAFNMAVWGRTAYDPELPEEYFFTLFLSLYPRADREFYEAFLAASDIIPELNRVHWHDFDFQWYPEGNCSAEGGRYFFFHSIRDYVSCPAAPGAGYQSVGDYCAATARGEALSGVTPRTAAENIRHRAEKVLSYLETEPSHTGEEKALREDMHAQGLLGIFYYYKILSAIEYGIYGESGDESHKKEALILADKGAAAWQEYGDKWKSLYKPQFLTRIQYPVDFEAFGEYAQFDRPIIEQDE